MTHLRLNMSLKSLWNQLADLVSLAKYFLRVALFIVYTDNNTL